MNECIGKYYDFINNIYFLNTWILYIKKSLTSYECTLTTDFFGQILVYAKKIVFCCDQKVG